MGLSPDEAKRLFRKPGMDFLAREALSMKGYAKALLDATSINFQTSSDPDTVREVLSVLGLPEEELNYIIQKMQGSGSSPF